MSNVRKFLYLCLNIIVIGWSILWLGMCLVAGFALKTFGEWLSVTTLFIIFWILGLLVLLLIRRIVRGREEFPELKIKKKIILLGILLFAFFGCVVPFLLIKIPTKYGQFYNYIIFMTGVLIFYVLFSKPIDKIIRGNNLHLLRPSSRLGIFFVVIFFFIFMPLVYFISDLFEIKETSFLYFPIFLVLILLTILARKRQEFNCPYCFKLIQIKITDKLPDYLDCPHCKNKIKIESYKKREKYLFVFKKSKIPCPNCNNILTLPRIIRDAEILCAKCGNKIPVECKGYIAVKISDVNPT